MSGKIVLARNLHLGSEQADKLEGLISQADVVGYENAGGTRENTQPLEGWESDPSGYREAKARAREAARRGDDKAQYNVRLLEIIEGYRKGVIIPERHSVRDAQRIGGLFMTQHRLLQQVPPLFAAGRFDESVDCYLQAERRLFEASKVRDERIVSDGLRSLRRAQGKARKEDVTYLIILGNAHDIAQPLAEKVGTAVDDVLIPGTGYDHLINAHKSVLRAVYDGRRVDGARESVARVIFEGVFANLYSSQGSVGVFAESLDSVGELLARSGTFSGESRRTNLLNKYVLGPLGVNISRRLSIADLREFSSRLGELIDGTMEEVLGVVEDYLYERGVDLPRSIRDAHKWADYFPFGEKRSTELVLTRYEPGREG